MKGDVVSIVEAAYELDLGTREWLSLLLERSAPRLDRGLGLIGTLWHIGRGSVEPSMVTRGMADAHRDEAHFYPLGIRDCQNMSFPDPSGLLVLIAAPMPDTRWPSRREAATWTRIAAHIAAGARLRAVADANTPSMEEADAVLSPSGALEHARPPAQSREAREALRRAARAIDRARTKSRSDEDAALDAWQGLVAGRWSLVDRFDSDGRRYLVARRNDPDVPDPRALTRRERQVLAYAALGHPLKLVAYSLGLSVSTIALHRARAMRKLGLRSQAEVVRLFTPRSQ
jgi:DNA-binding NarL/FixJ family response regulator